MTDRDADTWTEVGQPVEMPPEEVGTFRQWALLLAGPVLFMADFGIVYLAAEASCRADVVDGFSFPGPGALRVGILVTTLLATVTIGATTLAALRMARRAGDFEGDEERMFGWAGAVLGVGSAVAVLALGLPVLVIEPC